MRCTRRVAQYAPSMDLASLSASAVRCLPRARGTTNIGWQAMRACERLSSLEGHLDVRLRDGSVLKLPRSAPMSWAAAFQGEYDAAVQQYLLSRYVAPESLVVDVGAALGLWTIPLGVRARSIGSLVWAVEPHPNNHGWLERNIAANDLADVVEVHPCALGNQGGTVMMQTPEQGKGAAAGNSAIVPASSFAPSSVDVTIRRLDEIPRPKPVSLIKLDVEGFELEVLRGAERLLETERPVVFGEFSRSWLAHRGEDVAAYLPVLTDMGYAVFALEGTRSRSWRPIDGYRVRPVTSYAGEEDLVLVPMT